MYYKVVQKDEESLSIVNCGISDPEQEDLKDQGKILRASLSAFKHAHT